MSTRSHWQLKAASFLMVAMVSWAQEGADELTSLSYISYLERYATLKPATQGETLDAVVNMPVLPGDRVETARGARLEIQLSDGSTVWLDQFTTVDFDSIAKSRGYSAPRTALYLAAGGIAVEVAPEAASVRVDSPAGTVYLARGGLYRLQLDGDQLKVAAHRGSAELPAGMGSVLLRAGFAAWIAGDEELQRVEWSGDSDDFWQWVLERRMPPSQSPTTRYVQGAPRAYVLDTYGEWVYLTDLSAWGWRPRVSVTWVPYSYGRWYWTPAGWCWVSYEPWGWYPYHYGSWYFSVSFGWVWFYDPVWAPAWVHWVYTPGYVGWCPRGYYDWWWWKHGHRHYNRPHRWSEVSFDFSGRVRLGHIDHRPWTFVPEDRFTSSHIERVRLDPGRIIRSIGDREAIVRSGPLVGPAPRDLGRPAELRELFRDQAPREVTNYLRRETRGPADNDVSPLPLTRTSEAVRLARPFPVRPSDDGDEARPRSEPSFSRGRQPGVDTSRPSGREPDVTRLPDRRREPERVEQPERTSRPPSSWQPRVPRPEAPEVPRAPSRRENPVPRPSPDSSESWRREQPRFSAPDRSAPPVSPQPRQIIPRENPRLREIPAEPAPRTRSSFPSSPSPSFRPPQGVSSPRVSEPRPSSPGGSPRNTGGNSTSDRPSASRPRH